MIHTRLPLASLPLLLISPTTAPPAMSGSHQGQESESRDSGARHVTLPAMIFPAATAPSHHGTTSLLLSGWQPARGQVSEAQACRPTCLVGCNHGWGVDDAGTRVYASLTWWEPGCMLALTFAPRDCSAKRHAVTGPTMSSRAVPCLSRQPRNPLSAGKHALRVPGIPPGLVEASSKRGTTLPRPRPLHHTRARDQPSTLSTHHPRNSPFGGSTAMATTYSDKALVKVCGGVPLTLA